MTIAVTSEYTDASEYVQKYQDDPKAYAQLEKTLLDTAVALPERFRALFALKSLGTPLAIDIIAKAFVDPSELLKHELAYVLGQMKDAYALPVLQAVLCDAQQHAMVRHEAAEALGAIGNVDALPVLERHLSDSEQVVRETCELAVAKIRHELAQNQPFQSSGGYASIDPAPPMEETASVESLEQTLMDQSLPLFERYRAMFSLRNIGGNAAVDALAKGFHDSSALFRHEIAYVFGQMQDPHSVDALVEVLSRNEEQSMVRHECAEALGSIASDRCLPILEQYRRDHEPVVSESCQVALDMLAFEQSGSFNYASVPDQQQ